MQTEPAIQRKQRRQYIVQNILIPLGVNLIAGLILLAITFLFARQLPIPLWSLSLPAIGLVLILTIANRRAISFRYLFVRVLKEVSSSRCGDRFIAFAVHCFRGPRSVPNVLQLLRNAAEIRRHPNFRFLGQIETIVHGAQNLPEYGSRTVVQYLNLLPTVKELLRQEVLGNLTNFLSALPNETYLVLYGYSTTICQSIAMIGTQLRFPVFLIEDLQYGIEGSLGEHKLADDHLRLGGVNPILLPFDQIASLCTASANFVQTTTGKLVPLTSRRCAVALIGCEAVSIQGHVLVPSQVRGRPSETAKFLEVFQHEQSNGKRKPDHIIVVVTESFKIHPKLPPELCKSHAPLKCSLLRELIYLCGLRGVPRSIEVEFVKLEPTEIYAIVDDQGSHLRSGQVIDLRDSYEAWEKRTIRKIMAPGTGNRLSELVKKASTVVFDFNGVLADDEGAHYNAFADVLRDQGFSLTYEEYLRDCSGRTDEEGIFNLIASKSLVGSPEEMVLAKKKLYKKHARSGSAVAFPGVIELVSKMAEGRKRCFIVTSSTAAETAEFLMACKLDSMVLPEDRYCDKESSAKKQVYLEIIGNTGGDPSRCLLFDDSPANLGLARNLGIRTIGIATTRRIGELDADAVVSCPIEIVAALRESGL